MKVFKFGGTSLENVERIRNTAEIILDQVGVKLLIVISALGKTTNELEQVVQHYHLRQQDNAAGLLNQIRQKHLVMAEELLSEGMGAWLDEINPCFPPVERILEEPPLKPYDYYYDQIVSLGELLSSLLVNAYLHRLGIQVTWLDARKIIRTDSNYRDAGIQWEYTRSVVQKEVLPLFRGADVLVTQGFIGGTAELHTTTLGREGSDYSAAILANLAQAESLTIWKDVEGLQNADPKLFPGTVPIRAISYDEVIEMAYYGAQVIHPKTIKPLQNNNIPLNIKCFLNRDLSGTVVNGLTDNPNLPPLIILKKDQVLLTITARDFSFITGDKISYLYDMFHTLRIQISLMQNTAISFSACIDQEGEKIGHLIKLLHQDFIVTRNDGLELLTIRHYHSDLIDQLTGGHRILLEQRSPLTVQLLMLRG
ncbi:MAG TPA: aspartate kinase [Chitinophagaceae bacterium]|nr:aspartate kinase [Chitinophagaceae bacterium]